MELTQLAKREENDDSTVPAGSNGEKFFLLTAILRWMCPFWLEYGKQR
jgi:hypothetical protein